jgi:hypothetical protein
LISPKGEIILDFFKNSMRDKQNNNAIFRHT